MKIVAKKKVKPYKSCQTVQYQVDQYTMEEIERLTSYKDEYIGKAIDCHDKVEESYIIKVANKAIARELKEDKDARRREKEASKWVENLVKKYL